MVKNFLKHTLSPSLSTPPPFSYTTAGTPPPTASEPSTPSTPALSTASTLTTNTLASPTIHLPSALAALVPPSLLHSPEPLPRLIVFDLDYTLWPFWVDTHPTTPVKAVQSTPAAPSAQFPPAAATSVAVVDKYGETYAFYADVPSILWILPRMGIRVGVASRTHEPELGREMLKLMTVTPPPPGDDSSGTSASKKDLKPRRALDLIDGGLEIYPSSKIPHMKALAKRNGVAFEDMLFFDDEERNREVEKLGVTMHHVPAGVSWRELERGVQEWRRRRRVQ